MEVSAVLVDDVTYAADSSSAAVESVLYDFEAPRWVSVHQERGGLSFGPLTLVESDPQREEFGLPEVSRRNFGSRALEVSTGRPPVISYRETWTRPPNCVYALVLPPTSTASQLDIECLGYRHPPPVDVAVTPDKRIFHYVVLMGEAGTLRVSARITPDADAYRRALAKAEIVTGTKRYGGLRDALRKEAMSSEFWFKLLSFGGRVFGGQ